MDWEGKKLLAPMVRVGTLPFRLLALDYGADYVYTEELIDRKLGLCTRVENTALGCVDYVLTSKNPMHKPMPSDLAWRTAPHLEKSQLVLQLGTNDATTALRAAEVVCGDVSCIDVNMGCPMKFSTQMGAGAELLKQPEKVRDIVTTLSRNLPVPVTCKIRLLPDEQATVELARLIEHCGASALGVHARTDTMKSREPALWERLKPVRESVSIPMIANGDIWRAQDFDRVLAETGCAAGMFARGALLNPSVFRREGYLPIGKCMFDYVTLCQRYEERIQNVKYTLLQMYKYGYVDATISGLSTNSCHDVRQAKDYPTVLAALTEQFPEFAPPAPPATVDSAQTNSPVGTGENTVGDGHNEVDGQGDEDKDRDKDEERAKKRQKVADEE